MAVYNRLSTEKTAAYDAGDAYVLENTVSIVVATTADTIRALTIPAGTAVVNVYMTIVTQSDAATSHAIDVGDAIDPNGWDNAVNVKGGAVDSVTVGVAGTDAYCPTGKAVFPLHAKVYSSAAEIILTNAINGVPTVGSVKIQALCVGYPLLESY